MKSGFRTGILPDIQIDRLHGQSLYNSRTVSYGSEGEILWLIVSLLSGFVKKKLTGWT